MRDLVHWWNNACDGYGVPVTSWRMGCRWNTSVHDRTERPDETEDPATCLECMYMRDMFPDEIYSGFVWIRSHRRGRK